jgi:hypothetical protein
MSCQDRAIVVGSIRKGIASMKRERDNERQRHEQATNDNERGYHQGRRHGLIEGIYQMELLLTTMGEKP